MLTDLKSLSLAELERFAVEEARSTPSRGREVYRCLWQRGARSFDEMTTVARAVRQRFAEVSRISWLEPARVLRSADGTVKYLWRLEDDTTVESVLIPDGDRRLTLCMSSQVGCAMACTFCVTGDMGLVRQMTAGEIAGQALQVGLDLPPGRRITNLVLMGMGEPLHNLPNLVPALGICLDDHALNFSHRRITVSTVGLIPRLAELAAALPVNIAVSLNATTEAQRRAMMPISRRYPLEELVEACRDHPLPNGKRITFGYVLFRGINDSLEDADRLYALLQGIPAKVNLIPYNPNPGRDLERPDPATVEAFQHSLVSRGMSCHVRTTRGLDIDAACGQLQARAGLG